MIGCTVVGPLDYLCAGLGWVCVERHHLSAVQIEQLVVHVIGRRARLIERQQGKQATNHRTGDKSAIRLTPGNRIEQIGKGIAVRCGVDVLINGVQEVLLKGHVPNASDRPERPVGFDPGMTRVQRHAVGILFGFVPGHLFLFNTQRDEIETQHLIGIRIVFQTIGSLARVRGGVGFTIGNIQVRLRAIVPQMRPLTDQIDGGPLIKSHIVGIAGGAGDQTHGSDADNPLEGQVGAMGNLAVKVIRLILEKRIEGIGTAGIASIGRVQVVRPLMENTIMLLRVTAAIGAEARIGRGHNQHISRLLDGHIFTATVVMPTSVRIPTQIMHAEGLRPVPTFAVGQDGSEKRHQ